MSGVVPLALVYVVKVGLRKLSGGGKPGNIGNIARPLDGSAGVFLFWWQGKELSNVAYYIITELVGSAGCGWFGGLLSFCPP